MRPVPVPATVVLLTLAGTKIGLPMRLRLDTDPVPYAPGQPRRARTELFCSLAQPSLWLLVDQEQVVSEVAGTDAAGRVYADSLRLLEIIR